jgi:hypothetical protein
MTQILLLVPGAKAREGAGLGLPGKTCQRRQPDHAGDHLPMEAAAEQKTQPDPEHRRAMIPAPPPRDRHAARQLPPGITAPRAR